MIGGAVSSACRFAVCVDAIVLSVYRAAVPRCLVPSRCLLPLDLFALFVRRPRIHWDVVLASPRRHAVGGRVLSHRSSPRLFDTGSGELGGVLCLRWEMVSLCPHDVLLFRSVLSVWVCCLLRRCRGFLSPTPLSRSSCRVATRFASLRHSPRFATRGAGSSSCGVRPRLARRSFSLLVVLGAGSVSAWCVIIMGYSRRWGVLCGLCGWSGCSPFLWYICIVNWLYISFDLSFDMPGLPAATVIAFECSLIDNAILIEIGGGELPILEPDKSIKYAGLAASRIADFVLETDYGILDYLEAADFLEKSEPRLARAIRFVVDSLRVP